MPAPRVAILMPAYNAAAYIEHTVNSILRQSFGDLLLIAVDDGSTDETAAILARLAAEDARVLPITVENGGPAKARNRALEAVPAGTEFIMFSDADDEYAPDAIRTALEKGGGADLVLMGFSIRQPDGSERLYAEPEAHYTPETLGGALGRLYKANLLNQVWGKLFRAPLILDNALRFEDYRWGEDRLFLYACLKHAQSVAVLPDNAYTYIMHPGESLITRWNPKKLETSVRADEGMEALCRRFGVTDERDFRYMFMKNVFSCLTTLYAPSCTLSRAEKRREIKRVITDERVRERSRDVFGGLPVQILCAVIRSGSVGLNAFTFRAVAFVGAAAPKLFTRLKHKK
ncbi:MAG: glycosyltransferase family 2 protein [Oscillospiraceae bacterium]|nr:glycosyltransferase family 2 protein [Oscillospiraceae bacterium]